MNERRLSPGLFLFFASCGFGTEGSFIDGRDLDLCFDTIPVCSTTAGCRLGGETYIETSFPGTVDFIVPAPAEAEIEVSLFFREAQAVGFDTQVLIHEPGCFEVYEWIPPRNDIFDLAGNDRTLRIQQQVFFDGEHLVRVTSDAIAEVLIKADVERGGGR